MSKKLLLTFEDADENIAQISIQDVKEGVTKEEATTLANYLLTNNIVKGKKGELGHFDKAYVVETTTTELR